MPFDSADQNFPKFGAQTLLLFFYPILGECQILYEELYTVHTHFSVYVFCGL